MGAVGGEGGWRRGPQSPAIVELSPVSFLTCHSFSGYPVISPAERWFLFHLSNLPILVQSSGAV